MDTLTHALSGMLLARASYCQKPDKNGVISLRTRMTVGFLASAFPDSDFIFWFFGDLTYLNHHRGMTHSVLLLPIWAWMLSMAFAALWRGRYHWRQFYLMSAMGVGIHILGDIITAYGTMIFAPFSNMKFAFPTTFILDPWFSGIILISLLLAWPSKVHARRISVAGFVVLLSYIGFQASQHQRAVHLASNYAQKNGWDNAEIHALPQFCYLHTGNWW